MTTCTIDDQGWIHEAIGIYYPSHTFGPFSADQPRWIVLHGTADPNSTAAQIATFWSNTPPDAQGAVSTHLIIDRDGSYVQGLSLLNTAWGNSGAANSPRAGYLPTDNLNFYTISIEHVKRDSQDLSDITPAQAATSFAVIKAICEKYNIAKCVVTVKDVSNGGIIRHADCDALNRSGCPGPYPFQALQNFLDGVDMNYFIGSHANDTRVHLWNSFLAGIGRTPPRQQTGIWYWWVAQLNQGDNPGPPTGDEYDLILGDGSTVKAQNFDGGKTVAWINNTAVVL